MTVSAPNGFVVIDKPAGITSHDVVARIRRACGTRRVGHGGTLDPMATGVLVVAVGRATRLLRWVSNGDKCYDAVMRVGMTTTTDDVEGERVTEADPAAVEALTEARIDAVIAGFRGEIHQRPSSVSAIKVGGVRAHARVRAGEEVILAPRAVTISTLQWSILGRGPGGIDLSVRVCCSSGTYVRALARDIGAQLGVGGHLRSLRRTRVGDFTLDDAHDLDSVSISAVMPPSEAARRILPVWHVTTDEGRAISHGHALTWMCDSPRTHAFVSSDGELLAVGTERDGHIGYDCVFA